uniref:Large packaging protein n=1 Tax=Dinoroseobacter phage vB_DshS_R26L TaxID=3161158 RepID=A0AAU7VHA5_9CAUD
MPLDLTTIDADAIDPIKLGQSFRRLGFTMEYFRENPHEVATWLAAFGDDLMDELVADWFFLARDEQLPPTDAYKFWLYMAGRGSGKTRTGAEWTKDLVRQGYNRGGLIAPTAADARDVMVEGESGLLAVCNDWDLDYKGNPMGKPIYEPSKRRVTWENGAMVTLYSADEPERLRGPQHSFLWMDELAAWRRMETFDQAMFGLRLGKAPKVFISTTPKPKPLVKKLYARALDASDVEVVMTTGSSERNSANLAPGVIEELREMYSGSQLGRQELDGVLLEELEGALWSRKVIDKNRADVMPTLLDEDFYFLRIVVGVDPATTDKEGSDETGIVVAALGSDKHAYVLADYSGKYSPKAWGDKVAWAFNHWQADSVVAEVNQGGDMVKHVLEGSDDMMPVKMVHASRGKLARAEPVAQKYEQGKVHHVGHAVVMQDGTKNEGHLDNLEDQMCTWERLSATYSPDRIDALVWCIHELMIDGTKPVITSRLKGMH